MAGEHTRRKRRRGTGDVDDSRPAQQHDAAPSAPGYRPSTREAAVDAGQMTPVHIREIAASQAVQAEQLRAMSRHFAHSSELLVTGFSRIAVGFTELCETLTERLDRIEQRLETQGELGDSESFTTVRSFFDELARSCQNAAPLLSSSGLPLSSGMTASAAGSGTTSDSGISEMLTPLGTSSNDLAPPTYYEATTRTVPPRPLAPAPVVPRPIDPAASAVTPTVLAPNGYRMSRDIVSVEQLCEEFFEGLPGLPPTRDLYEDPRWSWNRTTQTERKFYARRRVILRAVDAMAADCNVTIGEAAMLLDKYRQSLETTTLNFLSEKELPRLRREHGDQWIEELHRLCLAAGDP